MQTEREENEMWEFSLCFLITWFTCMADRLCLQFSSLLAIVFIKFPFLFSSTAFWFSRSQKHFLSQRVANADNSNSQILLSKIEFAFFFVRLRSFMSNLLLLRKHCSIFLLFSLRVFFVLIHMTGVARRAWISLSIDSDLSFKTFSYHNMQC